MGLSESIEKILQNSNGQLSLDKINEVLGEKYGRQTILDFLQNEKSLITFDSKNITLLKYPLQYFIHILEDFIVNTGANRKDVFCSGAFYLLLRRQFPNRELDDILNFITINKNIDLENLNIYEIAQTSKHLGESFVHAMNHFFDSGWIEKLDSKGFYSFSQEFYEYFITSVGSGRELFSTPTTLVQLICRIIPKNRPLKVYNPAAGMLKLLTAIKVNSRFEIIADASEINSEIHKVGQLFAKTNSFELNFSNQNSLDEIDHLVSSNYDLIVSIPPFMAKINPYERYNLHYKDLALNLISSSLPKLRENGMAIFLVPDGVLFGQSNDFRRFRRDVIESELIHTIVSLPVQLFNPIASVKSSLLIFRKGINHKSVRFVDASSKKFYSITRDKFISLEINKIAALIDESSQPNQVMEDQGLYGMPESLEFDFHQLKNEGFSLNLNDYFIKYIQPQESSYTELGNFASQLRLKSNAGIELPYLRITDLNGGVIDEINRIPNNHTRTKGKILSEQAFLVGTVGGSSKPSWFKSKSPVEISTNIVALRTDPQKVNNEYLLQELNSVYVQKQMEFLSIGSTSLRHLRLEDLLRIKIKLPPLEDQIRISKNRLEFIQQQSLTVKSSSKTITDVDLFKAIKHEIVNILKGPEGFLDLLPSFLINNQISLTKPIIDAVGVETIGQMIERSQENIKQIFTVLENLKGILFSDEKYFNPQKVDLRSFLKNNLMRQFTNSNLKWYVGTMGYFEMTRSVYADIDTEQFDCLIRNIVSNVVSHGISGNELKFLINIENSPDFIQIHFMNNGNPFPADFNLSDYIAFGRKHGNSKGQGLGGYLIHKVVENHHGLLDILPGGQIFSIPNDNGTETIMVNVDILISIPKKQ